MVFELSGKDLSVLAKLCLKKVLGEFLGTLQELSCILVELEAIPVLNPFVIILRY